MFKKAFFKVAWRFAFGPYITIYVYQKCFVESKEYFGMICRIIRYVEIISRQERVTFVHLILTQLLEQRTFWYALDILLSTTKFRYYFDDELFRLKYFWK